MPLVMQGLYLSQRGCPYIWMAFLFLCDQLNHPDWDDYKKLTCVIQYLHETIHMVLILGMDGRNCIWWWIDASFGVHPNMHSHTRATMSLGNSSGKHLVLGSSTESEVIGYMMHCPKCCGQRCFGSTWSWG